MYVIINGKMLRKMSWVCWMMNFCCPETMFKASKFSFELNDAIQSDFSNDRVLVFPSIIDSIDFIYRKHKTHILNKLLYYWRFDRFK